MASQDIGRSLMINNGKIVNFVKVIGAEYCSGYIDNEGNWNSGFYCPNSEQSNTVFCCGSEMHKFCCVTREQRVQDDVDEATVLIGVVVGAITVLFLLVIVFLLYFSLCSSPCYEFNYKSKENLQGNYLLNHLQFLKMFLDSTGYLYHSGNQGSETYNFEKEKLKEASIRMNGEELTESQTVEKKMQKYQGKFSL